jgi:hypothetical protein
VIHRVMAQYGRKSSPCFADLVVPGLQASVSYRRDWSGNQPAKGRLEELFWCCSVEKRADIGIREMGKR